MPFAQPATRPAGLAFRLNLTWPGIIFGRQERLSRKKSRLSFNCQQDGHLKQICHLLFTQSDFIHLHSALAKRPVLCHPMLALHCAFSCADNYIPACLNSTLTRLGLDCHGSDPIAHVLTQLSRLGLHCHCSGMTTRPCPLVMARLSLMPLASSTTSSTWSGF